jgi:hypothetical protein
VNSTATTVNSIEKRPILGASPVKRLPGALVVTEDVVFPDTVLIVVACVAACMELEDAIPAFQELEDRPCAIVWSPDAP